jgi:site-specific recombinase XerD
MTHRTPLPRCRIELPRIYEEYLIYYERIKQVPCAQVKRVKRVLCSFQDYLQRSKIHLSSLKIEHVDAFLARFHERFAPGTCGVYRGYLRGFLSYLHHQRAILHKDLAALVVGPPMFAQAKPPKFLRPHEVQRLLDSLEVSSPKELRTYAMVHLAYFMGLRPQEITLITLDDIAFSEAQLTLRSRKNNRPIKLPLPEEVLKAIVAYLLGGRPKSKHRTLFLTLMAPRGPMSPSRVSGYIAQAMRKAGLASSAYWLRHTYAQNLLEAGASLYEIKEMLGHHTIESTRKYLHIHISLMRKVLLDEPL